MSFTGRFETVLDRMEAECRQCADAGADALKLDWNNLAWLIDEYRKLRARVVGVDFVAIERPDRPRFGRWKNLARCLRNNPLEAARIPLKGKTGTQRESMRQGAAIACRQEGLRVETWSEADVLFVKVVPDAAPKGE